MRLVFVHGMSQEGKDPTALQAAWQDALTDSWRKAGLAAPALNVEMPFYGDTLDSLTTALHGTSERVVPRGDGQPANVTPGEEALVRALAQRAGVTDADVRAEIGQEVVARGPANWEWVQGLVRALERHVPALAGRCLGLVQQVDAYLTRDHVRQAVDAIVEPALLAGPAVVVSHSLGTVVSYTILRRAGPRVCVPLFVTLGSPLGIDVVKRNIRPPPLKVPEGVAHWLNGTDERDYVALHARLDRARFGEGIENLSDIHNRQEDAHAIVDYLADITVSRRIYEAVRVP